MRRKDRMMKSAPVIPENRILPLDRFKGICVFLMLFFTATGFFRCLGPLYRVAGHVEGERWMIFPEVDVGSLALPCFMFLMGMSALISYRKRKLRGGHPVIHPVQRYIIIIGLGCILFEADDFLRGQSGEHMLTFILACAFTVSAAVWGISSVCRAARVEKHFRYLSSLLLCVLALCSLRYSLCDVAMQLCSGWSEGEFYARAYMYWTVLHALGVTGLFSIPFVMMPLWGRLVGFFLLTAVRFILQCFPWFAERRATLVLGGPLGCFGWLICIIAGMIFMDLYLRGRRGRIGGWILWLVITAGAVTTLLTTPTSARGVSVNYVLFSCAVFSLLFFLCALCTLCTLAKKDDARFFLLTVLGRNPILFFVLGLPLKDLVRCTSWNQAIEQGWGKTLGKVEKGFVADLVVINPKSWKPSAVFVDGQQRI